MNQPRRPFLAWPGWGLFGEAAVLALAMLLWWCFVYWGADWLTAQRSHRVRIHLDAELSMPFVPAFILFYRSVDLMFALGPFILRSRAELRALVVTLAVVTGLAGVGFLLLPAQAMYPPHDAGFWQPLIAWNEGIVLTYNMAPSLHVALSVATLSAYGRHCGKMGQALLALWGAAIALSTLLIHQHHLLDVGTGFLLGWGGYRLIYLRRRSSFPV